MNTRSKGKLDDFIVDDIIDDTYSDYESDIENLKDLDNDAYNMFIEIKNKISDEEPTLLKILKEPLLIDDRILLFQKYEVFKNMEHCSDQWLDYRRELIDLLDSSIIKYNTFQTYDKHKLEELDDLTKNYNSSNNLKRQIVNLDIDINYKKSIYKKYLEFISMSNNDDEKVKLNSWLNWVINIPFNKIKKFPIDCNVSSILRNLSKSLDKELYGMNNVKEQILLFVSAKIQNPNLKKCSLGLVGSPGTGKTAISRLLAKVIDFPFRQISLGGINTSDFLKGHNYTYIGSSPGEIVKAISSMKYNNGILFLDEFDKISNNNDICSSLLHITDPVQNHEFKDNYIGDIPIDLSKLWFIYSMNKLPTDSALRDRIHIIEVPGYTLSERVNIIINYLLPLVLSENNLPVDSISITKSVATHLVNKVSISIDELQGIRKIEQVVNDIVSKICFIKSHQDSKGCLKGLNVSFQLKKQIEYPFKLSKKIINTLI